jgi:RNA polymerase sigma-70 factor, ECF subfamily
VETVTADPDAELMRRVAKGDASAFRELFDRHQASIARFAFRFVGERGRAEELAQEIFFKLYRSAGTYRPSAKFKTFLFRVAANHCLNELRRQEYQEERGETPEDETLAVPTQSAGPDETLAGKELEGVVREGLTQMSERERAAFTLCRWEGMAYRDISEALGCSEAAVKSLIHRATLQIARKIEELERRRTA